MSEGLDALADVPDDAIAVEEVVHRAKGDESVVAQPGVAHDPGHEHRQADGGEDQVGSGGPPHGTLSRRAVLDFAAMEALVSVVMGSRSDWGTMENCVATLEKLGIAHDVRILSAHRTHDALAGYMSEAEEAGVEVFVGAAGGAAHLAGVMAALTEKPVLGVPMESKLQGIDSLLSMVQMPAGIPVATFAVGRAGAVNAALFAAAILAAGHPEIGEALSAFRQAQSEKVLADPDPRKPPP